MYQDADYATEPSSPLFYFGFGLSYTVYTIEKELQIAPSGVLKHGTNFTCKVLLSSRGPAGKAVVQIYASQLPPTKVVRYEHTLLCFAKAHLPANAVRVEVIVECEVNDLDTWDVDEGRYVVHSGEYMIVAAQHAGELKTSSSTSTTVKVLGDAAWSQSR